MEMSRRDLLKFAAAAGAAAAVPLTRFARGAGAGSDSSGSDVSSPKFDKFTVRLPIPPVARPVRSDATTDWYEVTQHPVRATILPGLSTLLWSYNGSVPGPTFDVRQGRVTRVKHTNFLSVPTTTHLHGGDTPPEFDGHPLDLVQPGTSFEHIYPGLNEAATLWYHDHAIHGTGRNVYMGLAGFFLVRDEREDQLGLPHGAPYEIPLVIQDRVFNADGSLFYPEHKPDEPVRQGVFGDVILVNGAPVPYLPVERRKYRFRMLNGSNARFYKFRLSTGEPITVVGSDGGFLQHPVETADLFMAEAERYDVVIDFAKYKTGTSVVLQNTIDPNPYGDGFPEGTTRDIMRFDVVSDAASDFTIPSVLPGEGPGPLSSAVATRTWRFDRKGGFWTVNGKVFEPDRIDARPRRGTTEIWEFVNSSGGWLHPVHPHLVEFHIIDRNGKAPRPYERGEKDVVALGPNEVVRVLVHFEHFTGRYIFHCHNLEHEDHDMMTQFEVI